MIKNLRKIAILFFLVFVGCENLQSSKIQPAPEWGKAVVFDIDGTLTPRPFEIWAVRAGANDSVWAYADKGYKIIYLSARPPMLQSGIPAWIKDNDLPTGYIFVPESWEESNASSKFKIKILQQLITDGWNIVAAYGDSSTDFEAYSAVGIPETSIYALKREGDDKCQTGIWSKCLDGWK
jgi:phosphatidate phosphatase PAH1